MRVPLAPAFGNFDLGGDGLRLVLHVEEGVFHHAGHAFGEGERGALAEQVGPADRVGDGALEEAVVEGQDVVFLRLLEEDGLEFLEFVRVLGGEVVGQAEIRCDVDRVPSTSSLNGWRALCFPRGLVDGAGEPAFVIDGAVAGDLEILGGVAFLGLGVVEGSRRGWFPASGFAACR